MTIKLQYTIATAAVISTSLLIATPTKAFWGTGEGEPTYENLMRSDYKFNFKTRRKEYDKPGWLLMTVNKENGWVQKMKLVDCRGTKCIFFKRIADATNKMVWAYQIDCSNNTNRQRTYDPKARWGGWMANFSETKVAFDKFCR